MGVTQGNEKQAAAARREPGCEIEPGGRARQ